MTRTILVVDDNAVNRGILCGMLRDEYEILQAKDGIEALAVMEAHAQTLSAVLLDIVMPNMDGFDVLRKIRENSSLRQIPIIVTTGSTDEESELKALELGANDFATKPYKTGIIKRRLRNTINLRETAAAVNILRRDSLTGLYNREAFYQIARERIDSGELGAYVIACIDIDNFKVINDQYGTQVGDDALRHVADTLVRGLGEDSVICRVAADNFAALYPRALVDSDSLERVRAEAALLPGVVTAVSVSMGQFIIDDKALSVAAMYDRAAIAKATVKGRYGTHAAVYSEDMRMEILRQQEIVNEMKCALESGQFEVWLQPQYNHSTGALIGSEALARWRHPQRGMIMPGEFIPVFERNGFIYELDKFIWEQACALLRKWSDAGLAPLPVSVNVSRYDIFCDDLQDTILGLVRKYGVPPEMLHLEITESAFAQSTGQIVAVVKRLIDLGFTLEIDDFGSGYSSLNTLKDVPAQVVKLDMRFLENDKNSDRGGSILESVVRMTKWLGMSVIAEGVETTEHAEFLLTIGCEFVQGYLYAKPMLIAEYEALACSAPHESKRLSIETVENLDNNAFWNPRSMDTLIFNSYVGGACIFEYHNGVTEVLRVNSQYALEVLGEGALLSDALAIKLTDYLSPKDREEFFAQVESVVRTGRETSCEMSVHGLPGRSGHVYLRIAARVIARVGNRYLLYGKVDDFTARHRAEKHIHSLNENLLTMMNDTPGGFARLRVLRGGHVRTEYVNETYCRMRGMTAEDILSAERDDAMSAIHPDDAPLIRAAVQEMIDNGETRSIQLRIRSADGEYPYFTVFGRVTRNEAGEMFINAYLAHLSQREQNELTLRETVPYLLSAIMRYSTDLVFAKDKDFRYICCSPPFVKFVRQKCEQDVLGKTDYDFFTKEEADHFRGDDVLLYEKGEPLIDYVEQIPSDDGIQHYCSTSKYVLRDTSGAIIGMYGIGRDITEDRTTYERLQLLTDSISGGLATYALSPDGVRIVYFNDGLCRMLGYTREEYEQATRGNVITAVFREDVPKILEQINAMIRHGTPVNCTYRVHTRNSEDFKWVNLRVASAEPHAGVLYANAVLYDVTEQKNAEEAARIHEQEMTVAISQLGRMICEYDPSTRLLTVPEAYAARYGMQTRVVQAPERALQSDAVDAEFHGVYREFFEKILRGEKTGTAEFREKWADGTLHWSHAEFSSIFNSSGKLVKAIITVEDTTNAHLQYELEQHRPTLGEENLLIHALFNLTTGETLDYAYRGGGEVPPAQRTVFAGERDTLESLLINEDERERYRALNDPVALLARFANGETELSIDYRRRMRNGEIIWVRNLLRMMRKPGGTDVLLFEYCYDIEEEKLRELMYATLVNESYDYVARINGKNKRFSVLANPNIKQSLPPSRGDDLDTVARELAEKNVHPDDREMVIANTSVKELKKNLARKERHQFTCRMLRPDGTEQYKKYTAYYLDRERDLIILTREDVSATVQDEMHKNAQLSDALNAANLASQAKSQFLSRMSHELRTPMNAIIGLAALSASEIHNPAAMEDAIGKIGMSARYLLSLINDILEMSRIESGKMSLKEEPFDFERLISEVNSIIFAQAEAKGLDYDAIIGGYTQSSYVGDVTKLQEVLINVLGNAVKFTPSGGKVTLTIEQVRCVKKRATMRFTVTDTGVGIDEAFLPHLFSPFSQEASDYVATSTGTGLGLAITKNLVEMMGGKINVKSIKNVGSVFTIDISLAILPESRQYLDMLESMQLDKISALVVDDDVVVCKSTESILRAMGMRAEWVDSGAQAVERTQCMHAENRDYDAIFIDWRMPDMDGVETARQIRKIVGPDVTIIIMTAYDFRSIEADARAAGVDLFMDKPLFQSSIVKAFETVFLSAREKVAAPSAPPVYDFSGTHILLAEDHPLNVEVARRLLEKVGAEVVVASNGLEALEAFATSPDMFFDAVLMDIRMPVMDGLTAARSIRNLRKKSGRSVPIIAMTANAFDEDVELSLSSGMNAHLTKPVDPQILFSTLKRLIKD